MANIEYSHNFAYEVETSHYKPGFTVTQGSWTRETTDRVLPSSQQVRTRKFLPVLISVGELDCAPK